MLINISNHPSTKWTAEQIEAAGIYGGVADLPFPAVDPAGDSGYFDALADEYVSKVENQPDVKAVMVQGEFILTYRLVNKLKSKGIKCVSAETRRNVVEGMDSEGNTVKTSVFKFEKFMEY